MPNITNGNVLKMAKYEFKRINRFSNDISIEYKSLLVKMFAKFPFYLNTKWNKSEEFNLCNGKLNVSWLGFGLLMFL